MIPRPAIPMLRALRHSPSLIVLAALPLAASARPGEDAPQPASGFTMGPVEAAAQPVERPERSPLADWRAVLAGASALRNGDAAGALRLLPAGLEGSAATYAAYVEARAAGRLGDGDRARAGYVRMIEEVPASPLALQSARALLDGGGLSPEEHLLVGRVLLRHGGTDRGVAGLRRYLDSGAGTVGARDAVRLEAGRALFRARQYRDAETMLAPIADREPEAALLRARSQVRDGRSELGQRGLAEVPRRFPRSAEGAEALVLLAELAEADSWARARELYASAVGTGVHSPQVARAATRLAAGALARGRPAEAIQGLEAYLAPRPPDAQSAPALYFLGRAQAEAGRPEAARGSWEAALAADPVSYASLRAGARLGRQLGREMLTPAPAPDPAEATVRAVLREHAFVRDSGDEEAAGFVLDWTRARWTDAPNALLPVAEALIESGRPIVGALLGREIQRKTGRRDEALLRIIYPFPHRAEVERHARRNGLDPYLVAGLIRQESLWNTLAVSPAGAVGLMQVMPGTARGMTARAGVDRWNAAALREPEVNLRFGTLFLAEQIRRWGSLEQALAGYNAGPTRVTQWRSHPEARDPELFVERIPFAETRHYVPTVLTNATIYRILYSGER
jgi:soluble lytic murein transglycosylase